MLNSRLIVQLQSLANSRFQLAGMDARSWWPINPWLPFLMAAAFVSPKSGI